MEFWDSVFRTAVALGVVLGLMMALAAIVRRLQRAAGIAPDQTPVIRVVGSSHLDPRKSVAVVSVAGELLVIGVTPTDLIPLGRFGRADTASVECLSERAARPAADPSSSALELLPVAHARAGKR
jgi:flagellar biosynthetic protein FliO